MKKQEAKRLAKVLNWLQDGDIWAWERSLTVTHFADGTTDADTRYGVYFRRPDGVSSKVSYMDRDQIADYLRRQIMALDWEAVKSESQYLLYQLQHPVMRRKEAKRLARVLNWLFLDESDAYWLEAKRILTDGRVVWTVALENFGDGSKATATQWDAWREIKTFLRIQGEESAEKTLAAVV